MPRPLWPGHQAFPRVFPRDPLARVAVAVEQTRRAVGSGDHDDLVAGLDRARTDDPEIGAEPPLGREALHPPALVRSADTASERAAWSAGHRDLDLDARADAPALDDARGVHVETL